MKVSYQSIEKAQTPTVEDGIEVKYAGAKRGGLKFRWYLLLLLVMSPVLVVLWVLAKPYILVLAPGIITAEPLEVRAPLKGIVQTVTVSGSAEVNKGDNLLVIVDPELDAQITELNRQLTAIDSVDEVDGEAVLKGLRMRIAVAQQGLDRQSELLKSYIEYQQKGVVPTSAMATVLQAHTAAKMALEQAKVDLLHELERQQIQNASGVVAQSRNQLTLELARLKSRQLQMHIGAPFEGRVEESLVQSGEHVEINQPLLWLTGRDKPVVMAYLNPKHLEYVGIGQQATIKLPNGESIRGMIEEPTEVVSKMPKQLSGPFDGEKVALKATLTIDETLPFSVEGVPVEISFDYQFPF